MKSFRFAAFGNLKKFSEQKVHRRALLPLPSYNRVQDVEKKSLCVDKYCVVFPLTA